MSRRQPEVSACPCGSGKPLADCCGPLIAGDSVAQTAEALMRSRYTAYSLGREDYLQTTWHPATRPDGGACTPARWIGLTIVRTQGGGEGDSEGVVEFVARYKVAGRAHRLHETSRFVRHEGHWCYLDGEVGPA